MIEFSFRKILRFKGSVPAAIIGAALLSLAAPAGAVTILDGSETPLQEVLDYVVRNGPAPNVHTDQFSNDAYWTAGYKPAAYLVIEIAGYAGDNEFGIYKRGSDPTAFLHENDGSSAFHRRIFTGGNDSGDAMQIVVPYGWSEFGFYLYNEEVGFAHFSDNSMNIGGLDHMVAYQGSNGLQVKVGGKKRDYGSNDYIFAWEDLSLGDKDYNDFVVLVQNINPGTTVNVPEGGATLSLLGLALGGIVLARRKATRRK